MPTLPEGFLDNRHPDWKESHESWARNERRLVGSADVVEDLRPFSWEEASAAPAATELAAQRAAEKAKGKPASGFARRQEAAVWPDLPAQCAERFVGALFAKAPTIGDGLDFGALGDAAADGTRAADLWANADGVGHDARGWDAFWTDAMQMAAATRFRWILAEGAPNGRPANRAEERRGNRPYLLDLSPVSVPDWHYTAGRLDYARVVTSRSRPRVVDGRFTSEPETQHLVMVRAGYRGLGDEFAAGGWWLYDEDGAPVTDADGNERAGDWTATAGEIPMARLFYEAGRMRPHAGRPRPSAVAQLGNVAVVVMNLLSAEYHDAFTSGGRQRFFNGVNYEQWNKIVKAGKAGDQNVPIPGVEGGGNVTIHETAAFSANEQIGATIDRHLTLATQIMMRELTTSPDASGAARRAEFVQGNSPRLAHMAGNVEEAQRAALRFLEMRWAGATPGTAAGPSSSVTWTRTFDLRTVTERLASVFAAFGEAAKRSPTLVADTVLAALRAEGLITDSDEDKERADLIRAELSDGDPLISALRGAAGGVTPDDIDPGVS